MKVLVLGGNGFIGGHLVEAFHQMGAKVRVLDRPGSLRFDPIPGVDYRFADFHSQAALTEALTEIDIVLHLVSSTVPSTSNLNPVADIETNLVGTVRLLELMRQTGTKRIVFLSSGGTVYGDPEILPVPETHPLNPISSYGVVKGAIESYLGMYQRIYGLNSAILRVSNPYGPKQSHVGVQGVIATFFQKIMDDESIKIWGTGGVIRDYIYIDDLVRAIVLAAQSDTSGVFNIGAGTGASIQQVLEIIQEVTGRKVTVEHLPKRDFDVEEVVLDTSKARQALGWQPQVNLSDGCHRFWQWLQSQ